MKTQYTGFNTSGKTRDYSYQPQMDEHQKDGTFGWVLALVPNGTSRVECNGPADGAADQISSGRAESAGVRSLTTFFQVTARYLEIKPQGKCRNYIDSLAAI
jgi:hypothetical protein